MLVNRKETHDAFKLIVEAYIKKVAISVTITIDKESDVVDITQLLKFNHVYIKSLDVNAKTIVFTKNNLCHSINFGESALISVADAHIHEDIIDKDINNIIKKFLC